jgi:hypothetical protein
MKAKSIILVGLVASSVALAIVVGQRLSAEAMAVIVGVIAGVAASIPTSLMIVWLATRQPAAERAPAAAPPPPAERPAPAGQPRLVVIQQPPAPQPVAQAYPAVGQPYPFPRSVMDAPAFAPAYAFPYPASIPTQRTFTVIGGEAGLEGCIPVAWPTDEVM